MNKNEEKLLFQAIVEILECLRKQPNIHTQERLVKEISKIAYASTSKGVGE